MVVVGLIISAQSAEKIFLGDIPLFSCAHPLLICRGHGGGAQIQI